MPDRRRHLPLLLAVALAACGAAASSVVTCEQLAEIAATTQKLRDQGNPLAAVLAETDKFGNKVSAAELNGIRAVVEKAFFSGSRFPLDVLQACKGQSNK